MTIFGLLSSGGSGSKPVNLSSSYNRTGIVADHTTFTGGGLDNDGYALSANLVGPDPSWVGTTFTVGPAGSADVVRGAGQSISLPAGQDVALKLLATGVNGAQANLRFAVVYTDGTSATFTQSVSDWAVPQGYSGESVALATTYRDTSGGSEQAGSFRLYGYIFALDPTRTVSRLVLPNDANFELVAASLVPAQAATPVNLSGSFNRTGIVADHTTFTGGGLDRDGYALSANLVGPDPSWAGTTFTVGPAGSADVVSGAGQSIPLPAGQDVGLKLLATGVNGAQANLSFTVVYTDGTSATFTQSVSDWAVPQGYSGESVALTTTYRDTSGGSEQAGSFRLYGYIFALDPTRTVSLLVLPNDANFELVAASLIPAQATTKMVLSSSFNQTGIYADGATFSSTGGLDGLGNALSGTLLGTGQTWDGNSYIIGPAGSADVVSAVGQTIALNQGEFSTLSFLATATNGSFASQTFTVTYTDGTTQTFSQGISDWHNPQGYAGETVAIRMAYRDLSNGTTSSPASGPFNVYGYSLALNPSKTVKSITLPNQSNVKLLAIDLLS